MLTILPTGGLCNLLRVVFSYYKYARSINSELTVVWKTTSPCPGYFLDYFEEIPHVNFVTDIEKDMKIDYKGCGWHPDYNPYTGLDIYDTLKLKPFMQNIISDKINELGGKYIAVHIRRTDHVELAKKHNNYTDDGKFVEFINKSDKNVYIATDNDNTYNKFKQMYPNRILFDYHKSDQNLLRETSLQDAIIDMYMCIHSHNFKDSGWSSFSGLILNVRKNTIA